MIGVASKVASLLKVGSIRTMGTKPKKRKGKIRIKQSVSLRPSSQRTNAGNVGHPTLLANGGNIKVKIRRKV